MSQSGNEKMLSCRSEDSPPASVTSLSLVFLQLVARFPVISMLTPHSSRHQTTLHLSLTSQMVSSLVLRVISSRSLFDSYPQLGDIADKPSLSSPDQHHHLHSLLPLLSFNIWLSQSQLVFSLNLKYFFQIMIGCEVYLEVSCIKSSSQDVNIHMESCNCVSGQFWLHTEIVRYNCWRDIFSSLDPALT